MEYYEIIVESILDIKRKKDFIKMEFSFLPENNTVIYGLLDDQSELFLIINKIRDLNIKIISIKKGKEKDK